METKVRCREISELTYHSNQRTANEYVAESRIYNDLISKKKQVQILNSASRILQCWSYHVKINFVRHQQDTETAAYCYSPALFSGAPNGPVPLNICSSGNFLLAGIFGKNNMSLEGKWKCYWEIDNSGCLRGFGSLVSRIAGICYMSLTGWIFPYDHTQTGQ